MHSLLPSLSYWRQSACSSSSSPLLLTTAAGRRLERRRRLSGRKKSSFFIHFSFSPCMQTGEKLAFLGDVLCFLFFVFLFTFLSGHVKKLRVSLSFSWRPFSLISVFSFLSFYLPLFILPLFSCIYEYIFVCDHSN